MISENIPTGFIPQLEVVSCYIEHDGKLLFLQRHPEHKHSSKWGLPAGKMDQGETVGQAIAREVQEETGLLIHENDFTYQEVLFVSHENKEFLYYVFHTELKETSSITINPPEHKQHGWFTAAQALGMDLIHDLDACIKRHYKSAAVRS